MIHVAVVVVAAAVVFVGLDNVAPQYLDRVIAGGQVTTVETQVGRRKLAQVEPEHLRLLLDLFRATSGCDVDHRVVAVRQSGLVELLAQPDQAFL